jgi:hypothetical protein
LFDPQTLSDPWHFDLNMGQLGTSVLLNSGTINTFTNLVDIEPDMCFIVGPNGSTPLTTEGFICMYGEEGFTGSPGDPIVWVTYNIGAESDLSTLIDRGQIRVTYDPDAGYEVHHDKFIQPNYG